MSSGKRNVAHIKGENPEALRAQYERQERAVTARSRGLTWAQVAQASGYSSAQAAQAAVSTAMGRTLAKTNEATVMLREMETMRLDRALVEITLIGYDRNMPPAGRLAALEALRRNVETRSKLLGLFAPEQHEVITVDALDRKIIELSTRLGIAVPAGLLELTAGADDAGEGDLPEGA